MLTEFTKSFLGTLGLFSAMIVLLTFILEGVPILQEHLGKQVIDREDEVITFYMGMMAYFGQIPYFIAMVSPISTLFATLYVMGNFYKNREAHSIVGAGVSLMRLTLPISLFMAFYSMFMLFWSEFVVTDTFDEALIKKKMIAHRPIARREMLRNAVVPSGLGDHTYYFISNYQPATFTFEGIAIVEFFADSSYEQALLDPFAWTHQEQGSEMTPEAYKFFQKQQAQKAQEAYIEKKKIPPDVVEEMQILNRAYELSKKKKVLENRERKKLRITPIGRKVHPKNPVKSKMDKNIAKTADNTQNQEKQASKDDNATEGSEAINDQSKTQAVEKTDETEETSAGKSASQEDSITFQYKIRRDAPTIDSEKEQLLVFKPAKIKAKSSKSQKQKSKKEKQPKTLNKDELMTRVITDPLKAVAQKSVTSAVGTYASPNIYGTSASAALTEDSEQTMINNNPFPHLQAEFDNSKQEDWDWRPEFFEQGAKTFAANTHAQVAPPPGNKNDQGSEEFPQDNSEETDSKLTSGNESDTNLLRPEANDESSLDTGGEGDSDKGSQDRWDSFFEDLDYFSDNELNALIDDTAKEVSDNAAEASKNSDSNDNSDDTEPDESNKDIQSANNEDSDIEDSDNEDNEVTDKTNDNDSTNGESESSEDSESSIKPTLVFDKDLADLINEYQSNSPIKIAHDLEVPIDNKLFATPDNTSSAKNKAAHEAMPFNKPIKKDNPSAQKFAIDLISEKPQSSDIFPVPHDEFEKPKPLTRGLRTRAELPENAFKLLPAVDSINPVMVKSYISIARLVWEFDRGKNPLQKDIDKTADPKIAAQKKLPPKPTKPPLDEDQFGAWVAHESQKWVWDKHTGKVSVSRFDDVVMTEYISNPPFFFVDRRYSHRDNMVIRKHIKEMRIKMWKLYGTNPRDAAAINAELWSYKLAFPLAPFLVTLLALTIGTFHSRKSVLVRSFFLALLLFLSYFILHQAGLSLAKADPELPAWIMVHLGNMVFLVLSIIGLIKLRT